ncbi:MAG: tetratricopeptide repeat protein, partial [Candidatus Obscuribacterales bacterium]|nr:tetratricopeptide repeat protein [Candidatus Obscuribacterales bacterium]
KAIELNPKDADAHYYLGYAYLHQDKLNEAEKELEKAVEIDPRYAMAYHLQAVVMAAKNDFAAAIKSEQQAIALEPDNVQFKSSLKKFQSNSGSKTGK